jgi:hypothetical protein
MCVNNAHWPTLVSQSVRVSRFKSMADYMNHIRSATRRMARNQI